MPRSTRKPQSLGSQPIVDDLYEDMNILAHYLDELFNGDRRPRKNGFILMVFPFGEGKGHRCNYISNAERKDVVTMLKEQISYFEGMPENQEGQA